MNFQNKLDEFSDNETLKLWLKENNYDFHENKYFMRISTKSKEMNEPLVRCSYNVIIDKNTRKIMSVMPWMENVSVDRLVEMMSTGCSFELSECVDGTQIRVFWDNSSESWKVATKNHPDANRATWSSAKSYYRLFKDSCKYLDFDKLDKRCSYVFGLCHPDDVKVAYHKVPKIYHLSTFNLDTFEFIEQDVSVFKPKKLEYSVEQVVEFLRNVRSSQCAGVIFKTEDFPGVLFKIESEKYKSAKELLGNCSNLGERMLELTLDNRVHEFTNVFPEYTFIKEHILSRLSEAKDSIYMMYMDYYVNNKVSFVPFCYRDILVDLNTEFLNTHEKITRKTVMNRIKDLGVSKLMVLLQI